MKIKRRNVKTHIKGRNLKPKIKGLKVNFEGGFLPKSRKTKGGWIYNDTRDYRFDPDMWKI